LTEGTNTPERPRPTVIPGHVSCMVEGMLGHVGRRDMFALATLGLTGVGIPLWLSAAAGAIGIPSTDDWVYMRAAGGLFRTGSVDMPSHSAASIGQIVMVQPLLWLSGGNPWAFTAFGLVMALIGVASAYLLARRFVGTGSAVMVVLLVEAFPGFAREAATFMTDVPAFALALLCLLLGTRWLQGEGRRVTLVASIGAGILG
jgi:4-amino-4-deoxy-L-arabinose transferase-like glycosyltransferase